MGNRVNKEFLVSHLSEEFLSEDSFRMAEDLGDDWWKSKAKEPENEKIVDEGVVEDVKEVSPEKKKKRRKKRKIEEVVDSNEMSSEDKVKEEINDILGLVQKEEISEWIDSASIRLDIDQSWADFLNDCETEKGSLREVNKPVIIVAASGQRCADIMRETRSFKEEEKKGMTAKLFAKHFKLGEQIERLKKGKLLFGVGTPSRIQKLMEAGVLNPKSVFLDYNYRNKKRQRLIDEKEVKK